MILLSANPFGSHKIVVRVEPQDLGLLAALVHENFFDLSCVACAKRYKSDVLLLVVYLALGAAEDTRCLKYFTGVHIPPFARMRLRTTARAGCGWHGLTSATLRLYHGRYG